MLKFLENTVIFEDNLPDDMTDEEYDEWFEVSWVEGVRMGPRFIRRFYETNKTHLIYSFGNKTVLFVEKRVHEGYLSKKRV